MKKCPLSSEGKFFEVYSCLFANLAAYLLERNFSKTLYNSRIFVLLDEVIKYFFNFVAGFSRSRCLPLRGIFISWSMANFCRKSSQLISRRYFFDFVAGFNPFCRLPIEVIKKESRNLNTTPIICSNQNIL